MNKNQKLKPFPSKLHAKVKRLIQDAPRSMSYIDMAKGTGLSEVWIGMLANNKIDHPSAGRLEALYNFLSDTPFKI